MSYSFYKQGFLNGQPKTRINSCCIMDLRMTLLTANSILQESMFYRLDMQGFIDGQVYRTRIHPR